MDELMKRKTIGSFGLIVGGLIGKFDRNSLKGNKKLCPCHPAIGDSDLGGNGDFFWVTGVC
jgi:hypothetical protein